jgi:hypothetical protein
MKNGSAAATLVFLSNTVNKTRLASETVGRPPGFGKLIADETEKWGKVIRAANIKPE